MVGRSFQDILNEKIGQKSSSTGAEYGPSAIDLDPAGLAFLWGQIGKFEFSGKQTNPYPRPKTVAKKMPPPPPPPRPAHVLSDKQKISFEYFAASTFSLPANFSVEELKKAFRGLALVHHPDRGGSASSFIELKRHFETLRQIFVPQK